MFSKNATKILTIVLSTGIIVGLKTFLRAQNKPNNNGVVSELNQGVASELNQIVDELNRNPAIFRQNRDIIFDFADVDSEKDLTLVLNYKLLRYSSFDSSAQSIANKTIFAVRSETCNKGRIYQKGISVKFNYYSNDNNLLSTTTVTPSDCGF